MSEDAGLPTSEALFEDAACGLLLTDTDGTIRRVNRTFCRWIGIESGDLVGRRRLSDLMTMGARIFHQTHWAPLLQMQGSIAEVKLDLFRHDGRAVPMMMNAVRRQHASGTFDEISVVVAEDRHKFERELIRARKRSEELLKSGQRAQQDLEVAQARLRLALESSRLFVWDVDPRTSGRRYEDDVALLLGYETPRSVAEADYAAAIDAQDREREAQAFAEALKVSGQTYQCVYRINTQGGVRKTVSSMGRGVFGADGGLLRFVGVARDISELTRERAAAEDRALFAEQMMGIVSHDLRNPLSAVHMSAILLSRQNLAPEQRKVVDRIDRATRRMHRLIADLLDFTVVRVGRSLAVTLKEIELQPLVAECVEELRVAFPENVLLHQHTGVGACRIDADRLVQLIGNLVANAIAYGSEGRPVRVSSCLDDSTMKISVHNEGEPLPDELLQRMFDPMTRGGEGGTNLGVGLGLFIVREIARALHGEVCVVSIGDAGTTFTAVFPR